MAALAPAAADNETIVDFEPAALHAPFILRCMAIFVDYLVLLALPVTWLVFGRYLSDTGTPNVGMSPWVIGVTVFVLNFLVLPMLIGKSLGKLLTGMTIVKIDGTDVGIPEVLKRNLLGYAITGLTLGLGFLSAAFSSKGRALHDVVARTVVVRARKTLVE